MPTYDYRCTSCGVEWEMNTTIAERDEPTKISCPVCEVEGKIERFLPTPPGFGDPMRLGRIRPPDSFKDILRNMKTKHRHNTINSQ